MNFQEVQEKLELSGSQCCTVYWICSSRMRWSPHSLLPAPRADEGELNGLPNVSHLHNVHKHVFITTFLKFTDKPQRKSWYSSSLQPLQWEPLPVVALHTIFSFLGHLNYNFPFGGLQLNVQIP